MSLYTPSSLDLVNSIMPPQRRRIVGIQSARKPNPPKAWPLIPGRNKSHHPLSSFKPSGIQLPE